MSLRRATGRGVMWLALGYFAQYAVTFAFTVVTARLLDPDDFGLMGLAVVVLAVGTMLADSGTQSALIHREHDLDKAINTAFISVPLAGIGAAVLGAAVAPLLAFFYGDDRLTLVTAVLSGVLVVRSLGLVTDAILQRALAFKWRRAVVDPLAALAGGVTATCLALAGAGVWALVFQWYASVAVQVVGSWILARYRPNLRLASYRTWKELAHYGRNLLGAHTVQLAFGYIDTLTVGRNYPTQYVGWYGAAGRLAIIPAQMTTYVAGAALFPAFSRMRDDVARIRRAFFESLRYIALLAIPLLAVLAVVAEPLVVVLFGEDWRPAGPVLTVMMLWILPLSLAEPAMELFKAVGKPHIVFKVALLEIGVLGAYLGSLWGFGHVTLERVAGGLGLALGVGLAASLVPAARILETSVTAFWRALRPAIVGGLVALAGMYAFARLVLGDIEDHRQIAGASLGPLVPLLLMAAVAAIGIVLFGLSAELSERGSVRAVLVQMRSIARRPAPAPGPAEGLRESPDAT